VFEQASCAGSNRWPAAGRRSRHADLIDFRSPDDGVAPLRLAFGAPRERLCAHTPDAFDEAFETHAPSDPARPLASFAVYDAPLADVSAFENADTAAACCRALRAHVCYAKARSRRRR